MFGLFFGKRNEIIAAPIAGEAVESTQVTDPTFAEEMLGPGMAIKPSAGKVFAPVTGTINLLADTGHAIGLVSDKGTELLIHIGLDTVKLNGAPFTIHVKEGQKVNAGDLLMEFDIKAITDAGLDPISPIIVTNGLDFKEVIRLTGKTVEPGDPVMEIKR